MNVFIVSFRVPDGYGIYKMVVVANNFDEAEHTARLVEPYYDIGSVDLIDPSLFDNSTVVREIKYIE